MIWTITEDEAGYSVIDYLRQRHAFSRRLLRSIKVDGGAINVNSTGHNLHYILREGDIVTVSFPPEKVATNMQANAMSLNIVYEDDMLLVVDKQAGVSTIPSRNQPTHTLANGILDYYQKNGIQSTVHVVTRLDQDTSGVVLIAKNRYCHGLFAKMQRTYQINRKYIAVVKGRLQKQRATIDAPIGRKEGSIIERTVTGLGKEAITDYNMLYTDSSGRYTIAEIKPRTGRTHQIRVHMAYIGHPLVGDSLYSEKDGCIQRHALHCHQLSFKHPLTQEETVVEAPVPNDMKAFY